MSENKKDLINKLKRLIESDNEFESKSAEDKLRRIMEKYDISEDELDEDKINSYTLYYHNIYEEKLLHQIIYKQFSDRANEIMYIERNHIGKRTKLFLHCTYKEYIEVNIQYEFYKELFYEDLDIFLTGFIYKHNIFPPDVKTIDSIDEDEKCKIMRAFMMAKGMSDKSYIQRIEVHDND